MKKRLIKNKTRIAIWTLVAVALLGPSLDVDVAINPFFGLFS